MLEFSRLVDDLCHLVRPVINVLLKDEGDLRTALEYYKEAIRLVPDFADAHSNIGNVYRATQQLDEALHSYKTALSLRPDFAIAHGNHAACLYDVGDIHGAIKGFKHAIHLEYNYPDVHNNLGNAYKSLNRIDEAIQCYRTALQLKPVSTELSYFSPIYCIISCRITRMHIIILAMP